MSANRCLLVVTYRFPPDGTVGGLRWAGLAKYLGRSGWDVHVLTAAAGAEAAAVGYHAYECARWRTLNDAYRWLTRSEQRDEMALPLAEEGLKRRETVVQLVRREIASLMSFPDESRGWTSPAALRARRLVRRLRPDLVLSSGPPHSAHVVARLAVAGTDVPLVVDLRDPWSNQSRAWQDHPIYGRRIARRLVRRLERDVLRRAGAVIANTAALRAALLARFPEIPVHWLPNGVDPERLAPAAQEPFPGLSVAHVGTLYGGRDPRIVLQAFRALVARRPDLARAGARLRFAGHMEAEQAALLTEAIRIFGLEAYVDVLGVLPGGEALTLLRRSRLALVLAQEQELQVPGKLYEAVYLGCRTVVVAEPDSASAQEAERLGVQCIAPHDYQGLEAMFERLADDGTPPTAGPPLVGLDYATLAGQLGGILNEQRRWGS
jgi:glycosyltransferase involved in cell wall biosynthesis